MVDLEKVQISRKKRAIEFMNKFDNVDGWLVIGGSNDPNLEYLVGRKLYSTLVALLTKDDLTVLVSKLEESMVDLPHIDSIETYYGTNEFFSKLIKLLGKIKGGTVFVNNASPITAPYAAKILSSHERIIKNLGELMNISITPSDKLVYDLRSTKTPEEIDALKIAVSLSVKIIEDTIENEVRVGMTEKEVAALLYKKIYEAGLPSFETIVAFGENTANPHHATGDKKLREGEIGYVDAGVKILGMCGDITRTFFTTNAGEEARKIYEAVYLSQEAAVKAISPGVDPKEPDRIARGEFEKNGWDPKLFSHGLGHPLGVEVHDVGPVLSWLYDGEDVLRANMALTVEPALYFKGKYGIRLEDDVIVTESGNLRLSKVGEEPLQI